MMKFSLTLDETRRKAAKWHKALIFGAARLLEADILPFGGHASRGYLGARVRIQSDCSMLEKEYKTAMKSLCMTLETR